MDAHPHFARFFAISTKPTHVASKVSIVLVVSPAPLTGPMQGGNHELVDFLQIYTNEEC